MRITKLLLNSTNLTLTNWLFFLLVFVWTCVVNQSVLWWQELHWASWLTELGAVVLLRGIPAGSVWILWLALSGLLTVLWMMGRLIQASQQRKRAAKPVEEPEAMPAESEEDARVAQVELAESQPELREKILRLHASLEKI